MTDHKRDDGPGCFLMTVFALLVGLGAPIYGALVTDYWTQTICDDFHIGCKATHLIDWDKAARK